MKVQGKRVKVEVESWYRSSVSVKSGPCSDLK